MRGFALLSGVYLRMGNVWKLSVRLNSPWPLPFTAATRTSYVVLGSRLVSSTSAKRWNSEGVRAREKRDQEKRKSKRMDLTDTWDKYRLRSLYQNSNCFPQSWPRFASPIILLLNHASLAQLFPALWILALGLSSSWACLSACLICPLFSCKPFWVLCRKNQFVIQKHCNLGQH